MINFITPYQVGEDVYKAEISEVAGTGSNHLHLTVGGYHWGVFNKVNGKLVFLSNSTPLTSDDIDILIDLIKISEAL